jgi:glycosyltransferase involved in cell wall biosynthesis
MKIVFLNDGAYLYASGQASAVGGTERDQWLLARALAARGWFAQVGVREAMAEGARQRIDGVEYLGIGQGFALLSWKRFLSRERPDWLFWQGASHLWGPIVEVAKVLGVRTIFSVQFDSEVYPRRTLFNRRRWWPLYAWGLFRTDRIFVQHGGQLSQLARRLRPKATILPKVCSLPSNLDEATAVKPHSERSPYVAWVGMLRQHKRPDLLVEIARRAPTVQFLVCGGPTHYMSPPGYGEKIVQDLCTLPNVKFLGKAPPEKAQEVISNAAVLLSTSDGEGFPNVFTQAWCSGTPIVSLEIDPDGIIKQLGLGTVPGSIAGAITDIIALLASPERRQEMAVRARRHIAEAYNEPVVTTIFEQALHPLQSDKSDG